MAMPPVPCAPLLGLPASAGAVSEGMGMPFIGAPLFAFGSVMSPGATLFFGSVIGLAGGNRALGAARFLAGAISFMSILVPSGMVMVCAHAGAPQKRIVAVTVKMRCLRKSM